MSSMNLDLVPYLRTNPGIALVGATNQKEKYGNIILQDMVKKGYKIIPINPRAKEVDGLTCYPDLKAASAQENIGLVVYVIPPKFTLESLAEAGELGLKKVWVQPGAGDDAVRDYLEGNGFEFLMDACVMVETPQ